MFYKTDYRINSLQKDSITMNYFCLFNTFKNDVKMELLPLIHLISTTTEDSHIHVEDKMTIDLFCLQLIIEQKIR